MSNRPAPMSKRILAALIDLLFIYVCVLFLFDFISSLEVFAKHTRPFMDLYDEVALNVGFGVQTSSGISYLNDNSSLVGAFNSAITSHSDFDKLYNPYSNSTLIAHILAVTVIEGIYLLLVPMLSPKGQTLGKMAMGLGVVDIRTDMYLSRKNKLIRFAIGFGVETVLLLVILHYTSSGNILIFAPLIVIMTIMISPMRQALHDVVSHANVIELSTATIFTSIEEKQQHDAELLAKKESEESLEEFVEDEEETLDNNLYDVIETSITEQSDDTIDVNNEDLE